jgi:hypothetical protein
MKQKLTWLFWLAVIAGAASYGIHSHQARMREATETKKIKLMDEMWGELDSTLAHQYGCPVFKPDLVKTTNSIFTFQINIS